MSDDCDGLPLQPKPQQHLFTAELQLQLLLLPSLTRQGDREFLGLVFGPDPELPS
jgi:hypothetical protein